MFKSIISILVLVLAITNAQSISYFTGDTMGVSYFPVFEGLKLHIRCYSNVTSANSNGYTALIHSGLPYSSLAFADVIQLLLPQMPSLNMKKACVIDRYGWGWSDSAPYPFTTQEYIRRLHGSLATMSSIVAPPYINAGWSWGSLDSQQFTVSYPNEVIGLFTIDGTDPIWGFQPSNIGLIEFLTPLFEDFIAQKVFGTFDPVASGLGLGLGYFYPPTDYPNFSATAANQSNNFYNSLKGLNTVLQEVNIMIPSTAMLNNTYNSLNSAHPLDDLPYQVHCQSPGTPDWPPRQVALSQLSTNSEFTQYATDHFFPIKHPEYVLEGFVKLANRIDAHPATVFPQTLRRLSCGSPVVSSVLRG